MEVDDAMFKINNFNDKFLSLDVRNTNLKYINSIRRKMLGQIPSMAIDNVSIYENTSHIINEVIAHRLGLIPIFCFDINKYKLITECCDNVFDEICELCCVEVELNVENNENLPISVLSSDLKFVKTRDNFKIKEGILICNLMPGQNLKLTAYIRKGNGQIHGKFSPISTFSIENCFSDDLSDITSEESEISDFENINFEFKQKLQDYNITIGLNNVVPVSFLLTELF